LKYGKGIAIAVGAFAVAFIGVWIFSQTKMLSVSQPEQRPKQLSDSPLNCDSAEAAATIKSLALQKFNSTAGWDLVPNRGTIFENNGKRGSYWNDLSPENLTVDSFRKRGVIGNGSICAALIGVHAVGGNYPVNTLSVEYTIEPTTDGKTMVSARFRPNS